MNVIFMGTPDFAVPCLQALLTFDCDVVGVFTQPDKPKGRGHKVLPPPVKAVALESGIPVFQPTTLRTEEAKLQMEQLQPDLIVVVAYGKILPKEILEIPPMGCVNVHASLLPKYRGAGPIQWSILNGEAVTGVTTMYMAEGLDTGDMILKSELAIGENETADQLHDRLSLLGAETLLQTLQALQSGTAPRTVQNDEESCYAPMLSKELCTIDFQKSAREVHNQIRGLSSWPCATTTLQGKRLKVYASELSTLHGQPGKILDVKQFVVACKEGSVRFLEVQPEGKRRMKGDDFLRGYPIDETTILGQGE